MIIEQKRIRSLGSHLNHIADGESFYISITDLEENSKELSSIGFTDDLEVGEKILPNSIGNVTGFNAHGKFIKLTDRPKETAYRQILWKWEDWNGNPYSRVVDVPYKRYPRKFIAPPSEELTIIEADGSKYLVSKAFKRGEQEETVKHIINLFLEIFGKCVVLNSDFENFKVPKIKRLNWQILPPGEYPWEEVEDHVRENIQRAPSGNQPVIENRVRTITSHNPNYIAVGRGGFSGYWVFGFPKKGIYILENTTYGNATYVFNENWEAYSHLSKKEILTGEFHSHRIIHKKGWNQQINELFN
ncbi:MAG: hypothetical protein JJ895_12130 [Balneolaceae bacterium]|nr:hypothetical protein [Balneolaceae bacterium]